MQYFTITVLLRATHLSFKSSYVDTVGVTWHEVQLLCKFQCAQEGETKLRTQINGDGPFMMITTQHDSTGICSLAFCCLPKSSPHLNFVFHQQMGVIRKCSWNVKFCTLQSKKKIRSLHGHAGILNELLLLWKWGILRVKGNFVDDVPGCTASHQEWTRSPICSREFLKAQASPAHILSHSSQNTHTVNSAGTWLGLFPPRVQTVF